jgi:diguanylate cyclase (GGDEF)-like protein
MTDRGQPPETWHWEGEPTEGAVAPAGAAPRLDPLTQLLTPAGLADALDLYYKSSRRVGVLPTAVLVVCKELGGLHASGAPAVDEVFRETARRLQAALRGSDAVARVCREGFLVILAETGYWEALRIAERIRERLAAPMTPSEGNAVSLAPLIGVVSIPDAGISVGDLLLLAQGALARSQAAEALPRPGKQPVLDLLASAETFRVIREPIVELRTTAVVGYELLTRTTIEHLERPADFLRLALITDTLTETDLRCLEACGAALRGWGNPPGVYHINIFPSTLLATSPNQILELVTGLADPTRLCLEVTEQQFFGDRARLRAHLAVLRQAGIRIALDDVGFGRTSLELLILLAPDVVKIDRGFVRGVSVDPAQKAAFRRLVDVVRTLNAMGIAEGVENEADAATLQELGVEYGQGHLWTVD